MVTVSELVSYLEAVVGEGFEGWGEVGRVPGLLGHEVLELGGREAEVDVLEHEVPDVSVVKAPDQADGHYWRDLWLAIRGIGGRLHL